MTQQEKKVLRTITIFLCFYVAWCTFIYLIVAFVSWKILITEWSEPGRFCFSVFGFMIGLLVSSGLTGYALSDD